MRSNFTSSITPFILNSLRLVSFSFFIMSRGISMKVQPVFSPLAPYFLIIALNEGIGVTQIALIIYYDKNRILVQIPQGKPDKLNEMPMCCSKMLFQILTVYPQP